MSRQWDRRRYCAIRAGTRSSITGDHNDEPQYERGQQQSVGQYPEPAHGTSDIGDDLASCPEVERAASIGSAYVGSNPRPGGKTRFTRYLRPPCCTRNVPRPWECRLWPSDADSLDRADQNNRGTIEVAALDPHVDTGGRAASMLKPDAMCFGPWIHDHG
jgi:hypothetical protein